VAQPKKHSERLTELIQKLGPALDLDDAHLLMEAVQTALRLESGEGFSAKPVVSLRDQKPYLDCSWMGMLAQITSEQARSMGLGLIQTAAEAESDAALLQFFRETGIGDEKAAHAIEVVRSMRQSFGTVVGERQEPEHPFRHVVPFGKPS
jgi:hypothetical protein